MNLKLLSAASFLIALLCHLIFFNLCIIVFTIAPDPLKPKFFFLGPILKQNDMLQVTSDTLTLQSKENPQQADTYPQDPAIISYESTDETLNPFTIQSIKKPLEDRITNGHDKEIIKSTFDTVLEQPSDNQITVQNEETELKIRPYRPLQFRIP